MAKTKEEILRIVEEYDAKLKNIGILKIKFVEGREKELSQEDIKSFIKDFIILNEESKWIGNSYSMRATTEADGAHQCDRGRSRSIGDIYRIALGNYNNPTSLLEVMKAVYEIIKEKEPIFVKDSYKYYLLTSVCGTIHRRVFWLNCPYHIEHSLGVEGTSNYDMPATTSYDEFTIIAQDYVTLFEEEFQQNNKEILKAKAVVNQLINEDTTGAIIRM